MDQITIGWQLLGPFGRTYSVSPPSMRLPLSRFSGLSSACVGQRRGDGVAQCRGDGVAQRRGSTRMI